MLFDLFFDSIPALINRNWQCYMRPGGSAHDFGAETINAIGGQQYLSDIGCQGGAQDGSHVTGIRDIVEDEQRGTIARRAARLNVLWREHAERQDADNALRG